MEYVFIKERHLARIENGETLFYGTDHINSTVLMTNQAGEVVWSGDASPFGDYRVVDSDEYEEIGLKFSGKDYDLEADLYYFNQRYYDASTGRFCSVDPIKSGMNWIIYASNSPMVRIDPTGLLDIESHDQYSRTTGNDRAQGTWNENYYDPETGSIRVHQIPELDNPIYDAEIDFELLGEAVGDLADVLSELPPLTMSGPGSTTMYKTAEHYTALGIDSVKAQQLADMENTANQQGAMLGFGLTASLLTGQIGPWTTTMLSSFSSTKIAGGSDSEALSNMSVSSVFGWIPMGTTEMSIYGEMIKAGGTSMLSQIATNGEVNYGAVGAYAALGLYSQLSVLGGIQSADYGLKILGEVFLPVTGSMTIEYITEEMNQ